MEPNILLFVLVVLFFGGCWFIFFGKAIHEDAASLGIKDAKELGIQATIRPLSVFSYIFKRLTMNREPIDPKESKMHKKAALRFLIIAFIFLILAVSTIIYMTSSGIIKVA